MKPQAGVALPRDLCVSVCSLYRKPLKRSLHTQIKGDVQQRAHNKHTSHSSCRGSYSPLCAKSCRILKKRLGKITRARPLSASTVDVYACVCRWVAFPLLHLWRVDESSGALVWRRENIRGTERQAG